MLPPITPQRIYDVLAALSMTMFEKEGFSVLLECYQNSMVEIKERHATNKMRTVEMVVVDGVVYVNAILVGVFVGSGYSEQLSFPNNSAKIRPKDWMSGSVKKGSLFLHADPRVRIFKFFANFLLALVNASFLIDQSKWSSSLLDEALEIMGFGTGPKIFDLIQSLERDQELITPNRDIYIDLVLIALRRLNYQRIARVVDDGAKMSLIENNRNQACFRNIHKKDASAKVIIELVDGNVVGYLFACDACGCKNARWDFSIEFHTLTLQCQCMVSTRFDAHNIAHSLVVELIDSQGLPSNKGRSHHVLVKVHTKEELTASLVVSNVSMDTKEVIGTQSCVSAVHYANSLVDTPISPLKMSNLLL